MRRVRPLVLGSGVFSAKPRARVEAVPGSGGMLAGWQGQISSKVGGELRSGGVRRKDVERWSTPVGRVGRALLGTLGGRGAGAVSVSRSAFPVHRSVGRSSAVESQVVLVRPRVHSSTLPLVSRVLLPKAVVGSDVPDAASRGLSAAVLRDVAAVPGSRVFTRSTRASQVMRRRDAARAVTVSARHSPLGVGSVVVRRGIDGGMSRAAVPRQAQPRGVGLPLADGGVHSRATLVQRASLPRSLPIVGGGPTMMLGLSRGVAQRVRMVQPRAVRGGVGALARSSTGSSFTQSPDLVALGSGGRARALPSATDAAFAVQSEARVGLRTVLPPTLALIQAVRFGRRASAIAADSLVGGVTTKQYGTGRDGLMRSPVVHVGASRIEGTPRGLRPSMNLTLPVVARASSRLATASVADGRVGLTRHASLERSEGVRERRLGALASPRAIPSMAAALLRAPFERAPMPVSGRDRPFANRQSTSVEPQGPLGSTIARMSHPPVREALTSGVRSFGRDGGVEGLPIIRAVQRGLSLARVVAQDVPGSPSPSGQRPSRSGVRFAVVPERVPVRSVLHSGVARVPSVRDPLPPRATKRNLGPLAIARSRGAPHMQRAAMEPAPAREMPFLTAKTALLVRALQRHPLSSIADSSGGSAPMRSAMPDGTTTSARGGSFLGSVGAALAWPGRDRVNARERVIARSAHPVASWANRFLDTEDSRWHVLPTPLTTLRPARGRSGGEGTLHSPATLAQRAMAFTPARPRERSRKEGILHSSATLVQRAMARTPSSRLPDGTVPSRAQLALPESAHKAPAPLLQVVAFPRSSASLFVQRAPMSILSFVPHATQQTHIPLPRRGASPRAMRSLASGEALSRSPVAPTRDRRALFVPGAGAAVLALPLGNTYPHSNPLPSTRTTPALRSHSTLPSSDARTPPLARMPFRTTAHVPSDRTRPKTTLIGATSAHSDGGTEQNIARSIAQDRVLSRTPLVGALLTRPNTQTHSAQVPNTSLVTRTPASADAPPLLARTETAARPHHPSLVRNEIRRSMPKGGTHSSIAPPAPLPLLHPATARIVPSEPAHAEPMRAEPARLGRTANVKALVQRLQRQQIVPTRLKPSTIERRESASVNRATTPPTELLRPIGGTIQRAPTMSATSGGEMTTPNSMRMDTERRAASDEERSNRTNIDHLARQVYDRIRQRLLVDAERLGRTGHR